MKFEIIIDKNYARMSTDIFIYSKDEQNKILTIIEPITLVQRTLQQVDIGERMEPTLSFRRFEGEDFLNALAQALIDAGYRDKAVSKDGEIKRLESHLEDMRKISFKFIDKE